MGITIITCSGVSNTGKLTTQAGLTPMNRCPGKIDKCIEAGRPGALKKNPQDKFDTILALDGYGDCCGNKKIKSLGINPDLQIIATDHGIKKTRDGRTII
ncbi:putative zinc-binding protein [Methanolacinia petrolearia]|uniref:putative zinc-binding protein n=1 Tax=Methanolacinia petrolearia TaxID=54120 RepID=UPI003BADA104